MHIPGPGLLVFRVCPKGTNPGLLCVSSGELISGCDTPGRCEPSGSQDDVVSNQQPAHSLMEDAVSGSRLLQPLDFWLWLLHTCLSASGEGGTLNSSWRAVLWYLLGYNSLF